MTENEAIRDLQYLIEEYSAYPPETGVSSTTGSLQYCISTLEEIQQYREIGTVEECREAVEKQKPKKCDVTKDDFRIYYNCPTCNHNLRVEYNHGSWLGKKSKNCSKCGQAIQWEESEEE